MRIVVLACILQALYFWIRWLGDLRERPLEAITLLLAAGAGYLASCYFILKPLNGTRFRRLPEIILCAAVLFRLTLWPLLPALSDDPFRYRWEGKLQDAGGNPYQARPNDPAWAHLRDATFARVAGRDFKAGYGPLIEGLELWTYRAVAAWQPDPVRQVFWFKLPYALCDLGVLAALWWWLPGAGVGRARILIYAWSPLPVIEFWATGHNDSLPVLLVVLAFLAAGRQRWIWAFVALSLAVAAKFWPILLFPAFVGRKRWWQWSAAIPIGGLLAWPYWSNVWENVRFMSGFVGGWRNNDSLFGILLWAAGDIYRAKYTAFALILAVVIAVTVRRLPPIRASLPVLAFTLMIAANCHPWYLTWILPLLVFIPVPGLLLWTVLAPLAYAAVIGWTYLGEWRVPAWVRWLEYVPVYGMLLGGWIARRLSVKQPKPDARRPARNNARTAE